MNRRITTLCGAVLFCGIIPLMADDDEGKGEGIKTFTTQLLRIAELNVPAGNPAGQQLGPLFGPNGADPLDEGSVEVRNKGQVEVRLRGAQPNQTYSAFFCRFGFGPTGCVPIGPAGAVATDSAGNGRANLEFPQPPNANNAWAGAFILTRASANQFVSGFLVRAAGNTEATDLEITGLITSLNTGALSFRVGTLPQDIFTDSATVFKGQVKKFLDLVIGARVEVEARTLPDGRLMSREVKVTGPQGDPPRRRGHKD